LLARNQVVTPPAYHKDGSLRGRGRAYKRAVVTKEVYKEGASHTGGCSLINSLRVLQEPPGHISHGY
jgi:hypothetical protein